MSIYSGPVNYSTYNSPPLENTVLTQLIIFLHHSILCRFVTSSLHTGARAAPSAEVSPTTGRLKGNKHQTLIKAFIHLLNVANPWTIPGNVSSLHLFILVTWPLTEIDMPRTTCVFWFGHQLLRCC